MINIYHQAIILITTCSKICNCCYKGLNVPLLAQMAGIDTGIHATQNKGDIARNVQGCGIRNFPIGGILDAPTQLTGSPTSTAIINNAVFVSRLVRFVTLFHSCMYFKFFQEFVIENMDLKRIVIYQYFVWIILLVYAFFLRPATAQHCSEACRADLLCQSWTFYTSGPLALSCLLNYETPE